MSSSIPVLYQDKRTFLHRRDPRVKIILFLLLLAFILTARSWEWMAIALFLSLILAIVARAPRGWIFVLWAIHIPAFLVVFSVPLIQSAIEGDISNFFESAKGTLRLVLAWTTAILLSVTLFSATSASGVAQGIRGLRLPPVVALSFQLAYRLLYAAMTEAVQISRGMRMKGVGLNPKRPLQFIWNSFRVAIPVTVSVIKRAPTLMSSIQMRGISRRLPNLGNFDGWDILLLVIGVGLYVLAFLDAFGWLPFSIADLTPF
ncbi:MAG: energy-coupling factor transporter transmembrane component T family protein [Elainellaceae cyanobacterium]